MATFIKTVVCDGPQQWVEKVINFDVVVSIEEVDLSPKLKHRHAKPRFTSQPLFCELLICVEGNFKTIWCHDSLHSLICKIGWATHGDNFTPPVDMREVQRSWDRVQKTDTRIKFFA